MEKYPIQFEYRSKANGEEQVHAKTHLRQDKLRQICIQQCGVQTAKDRMRTQTKISLEKENVNAFRARQVKYRESGSKVKS